MSAGRPDAPAWRRNLLWRAPLHAPLRWRRRRGLWQRTRFVRWHPLARLVYLMLPGAPWASLLPRWGVAGGVASPSAARLRGDATWLRRPALRRPAEPGRPARHVAHRGERIGTGHPSARRPAAAVSPHAEQTTLVAPGRDRPGVGDASPPREGPPPAAPSRQPAPVAGPPPGSTGAPEGSGAPPPAPARPGGDGPRTVATVPRGEREGPSAPDAPRGPEGPSGPAAGDPPAAADATERGPRQAATGQGQHQHIVAPGVAREGLAEGPACGGTVGDGQFHGRVAYNTV